jgi:hypothetical protein
MSIVIKENTGGDCSICWRPFSPGEKEVNHENPTHKGFHEDCFRLGVKVRPNCPVDGQPYDLRSRTDRVVKPALVNAAYAASFGMIIGAAAVGTAGAVEEAVEAALAVGIGTIAAGAAASGSVADVAVGLAGAVAAGAGKVGAGLAVGVGLASGIVMERILELRGFDPIAINNIGIGMLTGGAASAIAMVAVIASLPLTAIATVSVVGGVAAGILSLL